MKIIEVLKKLGLDDLEVENISQDYYTEINTEVSHSNLCLGGCYIKLDFPVTTLRCVDKKSNIREITIKDPFNKMIYIK